MSTPIPVLRHRIETVAAQLSNLGLHDLAAELRWIAAETYRKPAKRRAPVHSKKMTPELAARAKMMAAMLPEYSIQEIGQMLGVNSGRVSEALDGQHD